MIAVAMKDDPLRRLGPAGRVHGKLGDALEVGLREQPCKHLELGDADDVRALDHHVLDPVASDQADVVTPETCEIMPKYLWTATDQQLVARNTTASRASSNSAEMEDEAAIMLDQRQHGGARRRS